MSTAVVSTGIRFAERLAWGAGLACLLIWGAAYTGRLGAARHEIERFGQLRARLEPPRAPDQSLWSPQRIRAWEAASLGPSPAPLAVLRLRRLHIDVPVLEGTDDGTLDRGVGHVEGTARPGTDGNSAIAGHRDGFFRRLQDVTPGDSIEIETLRGNDSYRVERIWIVPPEEVSVLDPTPARTLTLITCYPFYFVGPAPQRFIVRAVQTRSVADPESLSGG